MSQQAWSEVSLGEPKVQVFGAELRGAIKRAFGTNREFAKQLGVSEGRVSQVLSGTESITAQTLDQLLACFRNLGDQERLHQSWVQTFAPSPLVQVGSWELEIRAEDLLASLPELMAIGRSRQLLDEIQRLATSELSQELRFRLSEAGVRLALFLQRPSVALQLSRKQIEMGQEADEPAWVSFGRYAGANASRIISSLPSEDLIRFHQEALDSLESLSGKKALVLGQDLRVALRRDRVLTLLTIAERYPVESDHLKAELSGIERLAQSQEGPSLALALEVKARLQAALGQSFQAEETLEAITGTKISISADYPAKTRITAARVLLCRGEVEAAGELLQTALQDCLAIDNLHHAAVIDGLMARAQS